MKMSFLQKLLAALLMYCQLKEKELAMVPGSARMGVQDVFDVDLESGEIIEQLELEYPEIKNCLNAHEFPKTYEIVGGVSMTIPDQTMSIRDIMKRFASGLPIDGEKVPIYEGEEDEVPDFKNMDLAERQEWVEEAKRELAEVKARIEEEKLKKAKKPVKSDELSSSPAGNEENRKSDSKDSKVESKDDDSKQFIG